MLLRQELESVEARRGAFVLLHKGIVFVGAKSLDESKQPIRGICGAFEVLPCLAWWRCRRVCDPAVEVKLVLDWRELHPVV